MVVMSDVWWFVGLGGWSAVIVMAIKPLHGYFMSKGCENMVAVYYNRKVAHMLAGGVPILASPIVFTRPSLAIAWGINWCSSVSKHAYVGPTVVVDADRTEHERRNVFTHAWPVRFRFVDILR